MSETDITSCIPFNFSEIDKITEKTKNFKASVYYAAIRFMQEETKLCPDGIKTIARARSQLADLIGKSPAQIDRMNKILIGCGMLIKKVGLWKGLKRLFLSARKEDEAAVCIKKLQILNRYTGGDEESYLLSYIAYRMNKSNILENNKVWCTFTRKNIADRLGISERTVDRLINSLLNKKLIETDNKLHFKKWQTHFTINLDLYNQIVAEVKEAFPPKEESIKKEANHHFVGTGTDKSITSIRIDNDLLVKNNNTHSQPWDSSIINLNKIGEGGLTKRQEAFLFAAFSKTIEKHKLTPANKPGLLEEFKYHILNPAQRKGVDTFKHAVNRCMKLFRDGKWGKPFGFYKKPEETSNIASAMTKKVSEGVMILDNSLNEHDEIVTQLQRCRFMFKIAINEQDKIDARASFEIYKEKLKELNLIK